MMSEFWEVLADVPQHGIPRPIIADTNNILFPIYKNKSGWYKGHGIYEFDIKQQKYNLLIKYPKDLETTRHSMCYNRDKQELCIYNEQLIQINMKTHKFKFYKNRFDTGQYGRILCINNEYHIIGGSSSNKHIKWNENKNKFDIIHTFMNGKEVFLVMVFYI